MRLSTTLSGSHSHLLTSLPFLAEEITAIGWHPLTDEAFVATRRGTILRLNGETGGVLGSPWLVPGASEDEDSNVFGVTLHLSWYRESEGSSSKRTVLACITNEAKLAAWDVTGDETMFIGDSATVNADLRATSISNGLSSSILFAKPKDSHHGVSLCSLQASMRSSKRGRYNFGNTTVLELKPSKQMKRSSQLIDVVQACEDLGVLAVATGSGVLHIWRFDENDLLNKDNDDAITASAFIMSPSTEKQHKPISSLAWGEHGSGLTKLLFAHEKDTAEGTLWGWTADFANNSDAGTLVKLRSVTTPASGGVVSIHPHLFVAIGSFQKVKETSVQTCLAVIDLEGGIVINNEEINLQRRTKNLQIKPPSQSKPKPPPKQKEEKVANVTSKRKLSQLFGFGLSLSKKKPVAVEISSPIVLGTLNDASQDIVESNRGKLVTIQRSVHISPVSGSIVVVEQSLTSETSLYSRDVILSLEASFLGSAVTPQVCFTSPQSILQVSVVPQSLSSLPMLSNGTPMVETVLEKIGLNSTSSQHQVILKRAEAAGLTVLSVDQRRVSESEQVIVRAAGKVCLLPNLTFSRVAEFEPATDACFVSHDRVAVLMGRSYVVTKRFNNEKNAWERASMKIRLQMDARRIFSTPVTSGGTFELDSWSQGESSVILYCGLLTPDTEFLCYSRNASSEHQEDDMFMLLDEGLVKKSADIAQPPTPQRRNSRQTPRRGSTQHFFPSDQHRSSSVAMSATEMDEIRQRSALGRNADPVLSSRNPETIQEEPIFNEKPHLPSPMFIFERGERVLNVIWSPFKVETPKSCVVAVLSTRRVILFNAYLEVLGEARESPTSALFVSRNTVAFTSLKSASQAFVLSTEGPDAFRVQPMLSVPCLKGYGPMLLVACLPERLVFSRIGPDRKPHFIVRPYLRSNDASDWAVRSNLSDFKAEEALQLNAPLCHSTLIELAKACRDSALGAKALQEMERAIIKRENPGHSFGSLSALAMTPAHHGATKLAMLEQAGDVWGLYRECLSCLASPKHKDIARKYLLRLVKFVRGGGSSAVVQSIRVLLGNETVNDAMASSQETSSRSLNSSSRLNRNDSAALQAVATASMRSGDLSSSNRLRRRETLPHPTPSSLTSSLPLSSEGEVFLDFEALTEELDIFESLKENANVSSELFYHKEESTPSLQDVNSVAAWLGLVRSKMGDPALRNWTTAELDEMDHALQSARKSEPQVASTGMYKLPVNDDVRRFSFAGSEENACVGYWRFEEIEDTEDGQLSLDLSRYGNHGLIIGESEYEDSAETCIGLELGGRRHPHALKTRGEGGIEVKLKDSCDLGPHQRESGEVAKQSFTIEMWMRLGVVQESVLCERCSLIFPWKLSILDDGITFRFETKEWLYVTSNAKSEIGKLNGFWRHVALVYTSEGSQEREGSDSVQLFIDGNPITLDKSAQPQVFDDDEEDFVPSLRIGSDGFWGELLEIRLWSIAREQWEISSMMETHLNLADRVPLRMSASKYSGATALSESSSAGVPFYRLASSAATSLSENSEAFPKPGPSEASQLSEDSLTPPPPSRTHAKNSLDVFVNPFAEDSVKEPTMPASKFEPFNEVKHQFEADDPFEVKEEPRDTRWDYEDPQKVASHVAFPDTAGVSSVPGSRRSSIASVHAEDFAVDPDGAPSEIQEQEEDAWRKVYDPASDSYYFFNTETGESVWTDPRVATSEWDRFTDDRGDVYYYNRVTGETSWDPPEEIATSNTPEPVSVNPPPEPPSDDDENTENDEDLI